MQYTKTSARVPSLAWGIENEATAKLDYQRVMERDHKGFNTKPAGILVSTEYPFIAATPDGVVSCKCCGEGLLEIKSHSNTRIHPPQTLRTALSTYWTRMASCVYRKHMITIIRYKCRWLYRRKNYVILYAGLLRVSLSRESKLIISLLKQSSPS